MRKQYRQVVSRWGLMLLGSMSAVLASRAQTAPPVQWQRLIDSGNGPATTPVRAARTSNGGYAILASKNLIRLSALGDVLWNNPLTGTYQDSTASYAPVRRTIALASTTDGGTAVLALDATNRYYVTKLDATGNRAWIRPVANADAGPAVQITETALVVAPDGSLLVVGSFTDHFAYLTLTKLSQEGYITGQWRVSQSNAAPLTTPSIGKALPTADGGFLLVGRSTSQATASGQGLAIKLDKQYNPTWQRTYPALDSLADVVANPAASSTYTAIGRSAGTNAQVVTVAHNGANDGTVLATLTDSSVPVALVSDEAGNLTVLDQTSARAGDFRLTNTTAQAAVRWTNPYGGSGTDVPTALLTTDGGGYLLVGTTTSTDGDVTGKSTNTLATWVVKLGTAPLATTLSLLTPTYNCQTGVIVFNTSGGNGTPITYITPGIGRARNTDNFGTVEPGVRNDPKVLTIQATQSGQTVSYAFDFSAYCRNLPPATPASPTALQLTAPTYNCQTGAITFHTTGGDSTIIEYAAPGITNWTTNPNQFVEPGVRTDYSIQPLTLMARQHGQVVMYVFDLKAECGRARIGAEATTGLTVSLLGNPVRDAVLVEITGAVGQPVLLNLTDSQGRLVEHRAIDQALEKEQQTFDLRQHPSGVLLLRTTSGSQERTLKVIKQ